MTPSPSPSDPELTPAPAVRQRRRTLSALLPAVGGTALIFGLLPVAQMMAANFRLCCDFVSPSIADRTPPKALDWKETPPPVDPDPEPPKPEETPPPPPDLTMLTGLLDGLGGLPILPGVPLIDRHEVVASDLIFDTRELDEVPRLLQGASPPYPEVWRRAGLGGEVVVLMTVDVDGRVRTAVAESESAAGAAAGVLDTVRRWRFSPGLRNGQAVSFRLRQTFRFSN